MRDPKCQIREEWNARENRCIFSNKKPIELVETGKYLMGNPDYKLKFRGEDWGTVYFNMTGYVVEYGIPVPHSKRKNAIIPFSINEGSISSVKKEIARANKEWKELR